MRLFLVTPYLVAAVQPCIEWIPIKEKKLAFLLLLIRSGCANYNAQGAYAVIFFISSDVSNALEVYMTYITVNYSCNFVQIIETMNDGEFINYLSKLSSKFPSVLAILEKVDAELLGPPKLQLNIEFQLYEARVFRLSFRFLWLCF